MTKPMIVPTAADVIRCIEETMERVIQPALTSLSDRSAATTIRHLLHYVAIRIDAEGQILFDDAKRLRAVLAECLAWLDARPDAESLAAAIRETLNRERDPEIYPSPVLIAGEVASLRQHVSEVLALLLKLAPDDRGAAGEALHQTLRDYIVWQVEQEAKIIEPAFVGRGPRR